MGRKPTDKEQEDFLNYLRSGRDEMNLLEHSISSASKQVDKETKSLTFVRNDVDPETKELVPRSWRVSFSADYGRPTVIDDDLFVSCLKLTAVENFSSQKVFFTRYQLCKLLGISICGKSFKAIDDGFNRLRGVHIVAKKAWYDNVAKSWVNRKFSLFDHVEMYDREEYQQTKKATGEKHPQSHFIWSLVMQESFDNGYVRELDLEIYQSLSNPIARKLYRYLGKHFWFSTRHSIDLQVLGHQKLGYQAGKHNAELRRLIAPAVEELEANGVYGLSHEFKASYGKCEVIFSAKETTKKKLKEKAAPSNPLTERLIKLGVARGDAFDAVRRLPPERVTEDIEHAEFEAKAGRVKSSKAGMLATMLKGDEPWPRPQGFVSTIERERRRKAAEERKRSEERADAQRKAQEREESERELSAFNGYMASLSEIERERLKEEAVRSGFWGKRYRDALKDGNPKRVAASLHDALFHQWRTQVQKAFGQDDAASLDEKAIG